jgi:ABC-2 type transport system permease protein
MMTISNAIIAYASLYRSEETSFFFALPIHAENTFVYRGADSIVFSSWGMATLVVPMIVAYGITISVPAYFYPFAVGLAVLFILLATELGAFIALLVALLMPRRKRSVLIALAVAALLAGLLWLRPVWGRVGGGFGETGIKLIMERIAFCQHWALPSRWVSYGMLSAARGDLSAAGFQSLLLLANVLFFGLITQRLGFYAYARTWLTVQSVTGGRRLLRRSLLDPLLRVLLPFLPARLRLLVTKDMKAFVRDPSQWSQVLLFFGLLGLYIVNLPRLGLESLQPYWHSLISNLNLAATCLTLATLTSRFVFPQLSLEGRRIWVTGLLPMSRSSIIWGKFFFTAAGTFLISGTLIALSDLLLGLPAWVLAVHLTTVFGVCCGLNGLAVGLGALYPKLGTDNPSKIVSSFGGTLNLICSICFLALTLAPVVGPLHFGMLGVLEGTRLYAAVGIGLGIALLASAIACAAPMLAGARAFSRMEF